jgi:hypothetical protein
MKKFFYILVFIILFIISIYQGLMIFLGWIIMNTILELMDMITAFASLI